MSEKAFQYRKSTSCKTIFHVLQKAQIKVVVYYKITCELSQGHVRTCTGAFHM